MTIVTDSGAQVEILRAWIIHWIERPPGQILWHYRKPKDAHLRSKYEEWPYWFYQARYQSGRDAYDGK
jgi:hypothetical protein